MVKAKRTQTVKQTAWVGAMLAGATPTEAARLAEYKSNHKQQGYVNTTKPYLMAVIDDKRAELERKAENKACDIIRGIMSIAYPSTDKDGNTAIVNNGDRLRALELLGKNCEGGMWTDRIAKMGEKTVIIIAPKAPKQVESEVVANVTEYPLSDVNEGLE